MVPVEGPEKFVVQNVPAGNPRPFFRAISLTVDQELKALAPLADIQDTPDSVGGCSVDFPKQGGSSAARLSLGSLTGLTHETWKVRWTLMDAGSFSHTTAMLTIRSTSKGPTKPTRQKGKGIGPGSGSGWSAENWQDNASSLVFSDPGQQVRAKWNRPRKSA